MIELANAVVVRKHAHEFPVLWPGREVSIAKYVGVWQRGHGKTTEKKCLVVCIYFRGSTVHDYSNVTMDFKQLKWKKNHDYRRF